MKKLIKKIAGALVVLAIIGYFIALYPLKVYVDENGDTKCESVIGLTVKC